MVRKRPTRVGLRVIALILLIASAACAVTSDEPVDESSVRAVVDEFFHLLVQEDNEGAYRFLSSGSSRTHSLEDFLAAREDAIARGFGLVEYEVLEVEPVPGFSAQRRVSVPVRIENAQGEVSILAMSVVREDAQWLLEFSP